MIDIDLDSISAPDYEYASVSVFNEYPCVLPLEPAGYETSDTEAMSSYLCRLAEAASELTGPYLEKLLRHYLSEDKLPKTMSAQAKDFYTANCCDKFGSRFCATIDAISGGTINAELITFFPLRNLTDKLGRNLSKTHREWCNECWKDDLTNNRTPYIRLYWLVQAVSICCVHNRKLQKFCAKCGSQQDCVPSIPRQWICDHCGFVLHKSGTDLSSSTDEAWISHAIYRLMDRIYHKKYVVSKTAVQDGIRRLVLSSGETYLSLAKRLNMPKDIIENAANGEGRPIFSALVDLCYRIDVPLDQFVFDKDILEFPTSWRTFSRASFVEKKNISEAKKSQIGQELKTILRERPQPPPRISHIAQKYKIDHTVLEYHFRKETSEIRRRWLVWNADRNLNTAKERVENLIKGVLDLVRHNVYPSDRKLRDLGYVLPSDLRRNEILIVLRALQSSYKAIGLFDDTSEKVQINFDDMERGGEAIIK